MPAAGPARRPAGLLPLMVPAIADAPRQPHPIPDHLCFTSRRITRVGGFTGGHALLPVYVWTAPGPYVRGGLSHILLPVVPGRFHPAQEALVSDRASVLLAADVAVAGARGKARSSPG